MRLSKENTVPVASFSVNYVHDFVHSFCLKPQASCGAVLNYDVPGAPPWYAVLSLSASIFDSYKSTSKPLFKLPTLARLVVLIAYYVYTYNIV